MARATFLAVIANGNLVARFVEIDAAREYARALATTVKEVRVYRTSGRRVALMAEWIGGEPSSADKLKRTYKRRIPDPTDVLSNHELVIALRRRGLAVVAFDHGDCSTSFDYTDHGGAEGWFADHREKLEERLAEMGNAELDAMASDLPEAVEGMCAACGLPLGENVIGCPDGGEVHPECFNEGQG